MNGPLGSSPPPGRSRPEPPAVYRPEDRSASELLADAERAVKGRFRIEHLAGEGGHSRVFAAREAGTGQRVAVKLLRVRDPSPGLDPTLTLHRRLVDEARSMGRLDHPCLCRVREVSIQGEIPFLVMDWAGGVPLDRAWRDWNRRRRLGLLLRVIDAVAAAHHQGVVHGDLKPANILVERGDQPRIVDFGLARCEADPPLSGSTLGGTPGHAAPEQFEPGGEITPATDVFALGVLLFMLLTDRKPYPESLSPAMLMELMRRVDPPLPESIREDTPPDLQKVALRALEREPVMRYADAGDMASDLRRYLRREPVQARPTVLVRRFEAQRAEHAAAAREWLRLGIVPPAQAAALVERLEQLRDSDARYLDDGRLTLSRVAGHAGVMLVIGPLAVTLAATQGSAAAVGLAAAVALLMLVVGVRLVRDGRTQAATAALLAVQIAAPLLLWHLLHATGFLSGPGLISAALARWLSAWTAPPAMPSDPQWLAIGCSAAIAGLALRGLSGATAFTAATMLGGLTAWFAGLAIAGELTGNARALLVTESGPWLLAFGLALVPMGLSLDWWGHATRDPASAARGRYDGAAILGMAAVLAPLGMLAAAWWAPLRFGVTGVDAMPIRGVGLTLAAAGTGALAVVLRLRTTHLRARLASGLRVVVAVNLVAGLAMLHVSDAAGLGWLWLLAIVGSAVAAVLGAVEFRSPALHACGLSALAVALALTGRALSDAPRGLSTLATLISGGIGAVILALAWWLPSHLARRTLSRWASRAVNERSRTGRSRTWR